MPTKTAGWTVLCLAQSLATCVADFMLYGIAGRSVIRHAVARLVEAQNTTCLAAGMSRPDDIARLLDWTTETSGNLDGLVTAKGF